MPSLKYVAFDLEQFATIKKPLPTPDDVSIFREIIHVAETMEATSKPITQIVSFI